MGAYALIMAYQFGIFHTLQRVIQDEQYPIIISAHEADSRPQSIPAWIPWLDCCVSTRPHEPASPSLLPAHHLAKQSSIAVWITHLPAPCIFTHPVNTELCPPAKHPFSQRRVRIARCDIAGASVYNLVWNRAATGLFEGAHQGNEGLLTHLEGQIYVDQFDS
jgi:hypothetical protein